MKIDRFTLWKWYSRALWVLLVIMIYGTISLFFLMTALIPLNKYLNSNCQTQIPAFSVPANVAIAALNPFGWAGGLQQYVNATYAPLRLNLGVCAGVLVPNVS